jgi:hypothetical protein
MTRTIELIVELEHEEYLNLVLRNATVAEAIEAHDKWAQEYALFG